MPPASGAGQGTLPAAGQPVTVPPPPGFGRQMVQLVTIPAVIVVLAVGVMLLFGLLAGGRDTIDNNLARLEQDSGGGRIALGLQDPRYKERGLAAYNIATLIPGVTDPAEQKRISDRLITILNEHVGPGEKELHVYLLTAVGRLGQPGGLEAIVPWLSADEPASRQGAVRGVLSWPSAQRDEARAVLPQVLPLLGDDPAVAAEAAAAVGELAQPGDAAAVDALRQAMNITGSDRREVQWNAAVALARLGDEQGSGFVVDVLLSPEALAKLPQATTGPAAEQTMSPAAQDRLMLSVLASARDMTDPRVWAKIADIAKGDGDYRLGVRTAALELVSRRQGDKMPPPPPE